MYYETFETLCQKKGVKPAEVSRETGISTATLTSWKKGVYTPKTDKLQKIADYFGVTLEYIMSGSQPDGYYYNAESAQIAQEIFDNPDLRALFHAARDIKPESLRSVTDLIIKLKEEPPVD